MQESRNPHLRDLDGLNDSSGSDSDFDKGNISVPDNDSEKMEAGVLMTCVGAKVPEKYAKQYGCFIVDKKTHMINHFY